MYGHGAAPPHRTKETVIYLRVLIAAAGFLSCGLLACVPLFRVAVLRRRFFDWLLAWVCMPVSFALLMVIGELPEEDLRTDAAFLGLLFLGVATAGYYLTVDVRHHQHLRQYGAYGPQPPHVMPMQPPGGAPAPYGYPQPTSPYGHTPVPQPQPQMPQPQMPPAQMPPAQPPQHPGPARIDQVRAELDELSDYLRRSDGGQGGANDGQDRGNSEGGR
ncbi:hypothetical protein ACFYQA_30485 [Streptomyces sp. NPDC005774]|uniref:hypothetical protein n=1 Tax=Streptomyces sp. NPDC005774 TaxID=3364728 RepID=UPI0036B3A4D3